MNTRWVRTQWTDGQSLIEVVIATAVIILLATGLIAGTTAALKANISARARSEATKLVQEGLEEARHDRDSGWQAFQGYTATYNPAYYCLPSTNTFTPTGGNGNPNTDTTLCAANVLVTVGSGNISYRRYATFEWDNTNQRMRVSVMVKWLESGTERTSQAETYLTQWR